MSPSTTKVLVELLKSLFTTDELRHFAAFLSHGNLPHGNLASALPSGPASLEEIAFALAHALERRGQIDGEFFARLEEERPGRKTEIAQVRAQILASEGSQVTARQVRISRPEWIEIELKVDADMLHVSARGSRMEWVQHRSNVTLQQLERFTHYVGRAVQAGTGLDPDVLEQAGALHHAILPGKVAELAAYLREAATPGMLLQRLMLRDGRLHAVPWEALLGPEGAGDFWSVRPETLLVRGAASSEVWEPREIRGAVKLLAIAPSSDESALDNLRQALKDLIDAGEIEWLEPIVSARASKRDLFAQLRRSQTPHILHFLGHGGTHENQPMLLLGDHGDHNDDDAWITAETLARELQFSFGEDLRMVVLEPCEGAQPGTFGRAAEILAQRGRDAVVAHLWPVRAEAARTFSRGFYQVLAGAGRKDRGAGDVIISLAATRRRMLIDSDSAAAFSPVLYLRRLDATIFDFPENRRVSPPRPARIITGPASELEFALLRDMRGEVLLGDRAAQLSEPTYPVMAEAIGTPDSEPRESRPKPDPQYVEGRRRAESHASTLCLNAWFPEYMEERVCLIVDVPTRMCVNLGPPRDAAATSDAMPEDLIQALYDLSHIDVLVLCAGASIAPLSLRLPMPPEPRRTLDFTITPRRAGLLEVQIVLLVHNEPIHRTVFPIEAQPTEESLAAERASPA